MRTAIIEVVLPASGFGSCILLIEQFGLVKILIAKLAVKALAQSVLPRGTGFDVQHVDPQFA